MDLKKPLCLRTDPIPNIAARKGFQYVWFVRETPLSLTVLTSALKLAGTTDYPIKACLSWPAASPLQHHQPILGLFRGTLLKDDRRKIRQHQNHRHGNLRRTFHFLLKLTLDHQMKRCILLLKTLKVKDQIKNGLNRMIHNIYIYTWRIPHILPIPDPTKPMGKPFGERTGLPGKIQVFHCHPSLLESRV